MSESGTDHDDAPDNNTNEREVLAKTTDERNDMIDRLRNSYVIPRSQY